MLQCCHIIESSHVQSANWITGYLKIHYIRPVWKLQFTNDES